MSEENLKKLLIGVPLHHSANPCYWQGYGNVLLQGIPGWKFTWEEVGGCGIIEARDYIATRALKEGYDACLMLATDIAFSAATISLILEHHGKPNVGVVGGLYSLKTYPLRYCLNVNEETRQCKTDPKTGLRRVHETGTDFFYINTEVIRKITELHPELEYDADDTPLKQFGTVWNVFGMGIVKEPMSGRIRRRFLTEDFWFCYLAREAGYHIFVDTRIQLKHYGSHCYDAGEIAKKQPKFNWPLEFNIPQDHCQDVLQGSYEVPYEPRNAPVILDIGANVGAFARWASNRWPGAKIHSYEPNPKNFSTLQKTIDYFKLTNVTAYEVAASNKTGEGQLNFDGLNCGEWTLAKMDSPKESVTVKLIDSATMPKADVIKVDTEGSEMVILSSLDESGHLNQANAVMLEYHADSFIKPITEILERNGLSFISENRLSENRGELKFMRQKKLDAS